MQKTQRRRRKEAKTDYPSRLALLKSDKPRLVVRKSNKYLLAQIVVSENAQDKVIERATSKELLEKGWPKEKSGSLKGLAAGYLTGYLLAKKLKGSVKEAILDLGLNRNIHGSRIYSVVSGAIDGGLHIPHDKNALPTQERMNSNKNVSGLLKIKEKM